MIIKNDWLMKPIEWGNDNLYTLIGDNEVGKLAAVREIMHWCRNNNFEYTVYSPIGQDESLDMIRALPNNKIEYAAFLLGQVTDFDQELSEEWHDAFNRENNTVLSRADLIRRVLEVTGTGYLRMFTMIVQAIQNHKANYYFMLNPETSIHPVLFHPFIDFLINHVAKFMKFVVVTNCANPHMHYSHLSNTIQIVDSV